MRTQDAARCIDEARLQGRSDAMAAIGAIPGRGVNRAALTDEDIRARALLVGWAKARGFAIATDDCANLFIRRAGRDPDAAPIVTGSHMDSQPRGGRFDGIYGVLAGFEALEALEEAGIATTRPIDLVAWTNEEGGRFAPGCMGSMSFTGARPLSDFLGATDVDGVTFGAALARTLAALPEAGHRPFGFPIAAYVEAHIEQGPRLEAAGRPIGVVTGIQGSRWFRVTVEGETAHAGAAPLAGRRDALRSAVAIIAALQDLTADPEDAVRFTVGRLEVAPNSPNTVPNRVVFSIDLRHPDHATLDRLASAIAPCCEGAAGPCRVRVESTFTADPAIFDADITATIEAETRALGYPYLVMPSGAFHDAQLLSRICPAGMIFIPCEKGISHNEAENATSADMAAGARVLAATLVRLAG